MAIRFSEISLGDTPTHQARIHLGRAMAIRFSEISLSDTPTHQARIHEGCAMVIRFSEMSLSDTPTRQTRIHRASIERCGASSNTQMYQYIGREGGSLLKEVHKAA